MSSSFPPPGPSAAYPQAFPASGHAPGQTWQQPPPVTFGYPPPRQGNGLAIAGVVLGGLALLGVILMALFIGVGSASAPSYVLSGKVAPIGKTVVGSELQSSLTKAVEDDGGSVDEISCPDSSAVGQGLVTVCHGSVDGMDWTGIVVFEDEAGTFIVNQL
jgi:hypothetical protein